MNLEHVTQNFRGVRFGVGRVVKLKKLTPVIVLKTDGLNAVTTQ